MNDKSGVKDYEHKSSLTLIDSVSNAEEGRRPTEQLRFFADFLYVYHFKRGAANLRWVTDARIAAKTR
jgi:hypothetical protein